MPAITHRAAMRCAGSPPTKPAQRVEQQRMMRHDEIRPDGQRLVHDFVGHVDAYQHAAHLRIGRTDIQAAVVVAFLQTEQSGLPRSLRPLLSLSFSV